MQAHDGFPILEPGTTPRGLLIRLTIDPCGQSRTGTFSHGARSSSESARASQPQRVAAIRPADWVDVAADCESRIAYLPACDTVTVCPAMVSVPCLVGMFVPGLTL